MNISLLVMPKAEICSYYHIIRVKKSFDDILNKFFCRDLAELSGKRAFDQIIHLPLQMHLPLFVIHQNLRIQALFFPQRPHVERAYYTVDLILFSIFPYLLHQFLVALMQAVKLSKRNC